MEKQARWRIVKQMLLPFLIPYFGLGPYCKTPRVQNHLLDHYDCLI